MIRASYLTQLDEATIRTVDIGPEIFETSIERPEDHSSWDFRQQHTSWEEALEGHRRAVKYALAVLADQKPTRL
jgi:hypothetical protein